MLRNVTVHVLFIFNEMLSTSQWTVFKKRLDKTIVLSTHLIGLVAHDTARLSVMLNNKGL